MSELVILSEAKDLLARIERRKMILRFAQDDKFSLLDRWHGERHTTIQQGTKDQQSWN